MQGVLNVLTAIWEFFTTYILRNAPFTSSISAGTGPKW